MSRVDCNGDNVKLWELDWNWRGRFLVVDEWGGLAGWVLGVRCA
jgi:hypothetical protein